jgi:hypothetical protein
MAIMAGMELPGPGRQELPFFRPSFAQAHRIQAQVIALGKRVAPDTLEAQGVLARRQFEAAEVVVRDLEVLRIEVVIGDLPSGHIVVAEPERAPRAGGHHRKPTSSLESKESYLQLCGTIPGGGRQNVS